MNFDPETHPHRRLNPLTGEWILVSPHRTLRPWHGQKERAVGGDLPQYDPHCYLCPGNSRAGGAVNPDYRDTFVFRNDYPALLPDKPPGGRPDEELLRREPVQGECRVVCFSPRHDLTLSEMDVGQVARVVDLWADQVGDLGARFRWVQVFENKGELMGCSNPHPHGQIWAGSFLPRFPAQEEARQREYLQNHASPLLLDYVRLELREQVRHVDSSEHWVVLVPYWALWPFELLLIPRRHVLRLTDLTAAERTDLAAILQRSLTRCDNLFETSFPYSMGWHGAPTDDGEYGHWQLHAHCYPPLLRSAEVKKFLVGYEMLGEPQRDITAEQAARRLREISTVHFNARRAAPRTE